MRPAWAQSNGLKSIVVETLEFLNQHCTWIVDIDLEKFFDTADHDRLMNLVARGVSDGDVVFLIGKYLVSGVMIDDEYKESVIGTPRGGNLSPLFIFSVKLKRRVREPYARCLRGR